MLKNKKMLIPPASKNKHYVVALLRNNYTIVYKHFQFYYEFN